MLRECCWLRRTGPGAVARAGPAGRCLQNVPLMPLANGAPLAGMRRYELTSGGLVLTAVETAGERW